MVFAGLGFGVSILNRKFLSVDGDSQSLGAGDSGEKTGSGDRKGQAVDLVVRDEDLPSDEVTGQYIVSSGRSMLTPDDVRQVSAAPAQAQAAYSRADAVKAANKTAATTEGGAQLSDFSGSQTDTEKQFVPVRNLETLYNVSGKESVQPGTPAGKSETSVQKPAPSSSDRTFTAEDEDLDVLPSMEDMGDLDSAPSGSSYGESGVNTESDFALSGVSRKAADETVIQDAPLMAKAISTILSNES
ncbi:MAG: hypothetical protein MJ181_00320 [Treponema sp.]|nr:hypothetical protein [Treponema sp.]